MPRSVCSQLLTCGRPPAFVARGCHASVYAAYKKLGEGDLIKGFEKMNQMPYAEARTLVTHPVAEGGAQGARRIESGTRLRHAQPCDGRPRRADRRSQSGEGRGRARRCTRGASPAPAKGAVLSRFRRGRELDR